jgi:hypothetical protein
MNIAVLIGVSEYRVVDRLPACAADVAQMRRLLSATKKYDDIGCLTTNTDSGPLKDALRGFFGRYQSGSAINEAFVYFSGHGVYHTDALLCCSDFDPNRPATTSISNEELDDLLRSVNPDVAVKVIDACQSGSPYIKDATAGFEKALRSTRLKAFICMASSRQDQSSYATAEASTFTTRWIDAALYKRDGTVLYRDIQAALADAFVGTPDQTPFFVNQGSGLEPFAGVTPEMRALAGERLKSAAPTQSGESVLDSVAEEVARMDGLYVPAAEATATIAQAGKDLERASLTDPAVTRFYEKRVSTGGKLSGLPRGKAVAEFAAEQGWPKKYFVSLVYERYRVRVPKDPMASILGGLYRRLGDEDYVWETRSRPTKLEASQPLPFEVAEVFFEPKAHPSLKSFALYVGIVHSLTAVIVLSAVVRLIEKGWDERAPDLSEVQWRYQNYLWRDIVAQPDLLWQEALGRGQDVVKAYLESLVPKKEEADVAPASTGSGAPKSEA